VLDAGRRGLGWVFCLGSRAAVEARERFRSSLATREANVRAAIPCIRMQTVANGSGSVLPINSGLVVPLPRARDEGCISSSDHCLLPTEP
jgi:N-methylhydantoinase A/oxoprolinase/acetone carboxylase beta subunit